MKLYEWERRKNGHLHQSISICEDGFLLGAGTKLAEFGQSEIGPTDFAIDGQEERILALLSVAYWSPISPNALGFMR
ncbi:MAG TPA: hypothetical protein VET85_15630, partial [Stellaceae bacterium]|nr:hypothetical protein [Stellaceae bacterium]